MKMIMIISGLKGIMLVLGCWIVCFYFLILLKLTLIANAISSFKWQNIVTFCLLRIRRAHSRIAQQKVNFVLQPVQSTWAGFIALKWEQLIKTQPAQVYYTKRLKLFNVDCGIIIICWRNLAGFKTFLSYRSNWAPSDSEGTVYGKYTSASWINWRIDFILS